MKKGDKMLRLFLAFAVAVSICGCSHLQAMDAGKPSSSSFTRLEQGVIGEDGALRVSPKVVVGAKIDFAAMKTADELSSQWTVTNNYSDGVEIALGKLDGMSGLLLKGKGKSDTCFMMQSKPFAVAPGGRFRLSIGVCSALNLDQVYYRGWGETCHNVISWIDENGKGVKSEPFTLPRVRRDRVSENVITGDVPPNAVKAVVQVGADAPNLRWSSEYILYTHVNFESTVGNGELSPACAAVSRSMFFGKGSAQNFSWEADIPEGTSIDFKLFRCADANGSPDGQWVFMKSLSKVAAIGSTPLSHTNCWIRYEATLTAANGVTPALRRVACGNAVDAKWIGVDNAAPAVRQLSPTRVRDAKAPVEFEITDDSAIAWKTLRVTLDGQDITAAVKRLAGGRLRYAPAGGLAPQAADKVKHGDANFHEFIIAVKDELGNEAFEYGFVHVTDRTSPNHFSLRKDGAVLLNGKPFFPIGIYGVKKCDHNGNDIEKACEEMKSVGFNVAHTYIQNPQKGSEEMQEFLTAAEHHGLKVFINSGNIAGDYSMDFSNIARQFSSPALMAWYIGDDSATFLNADDMKQRSDFLHRIDPGHLTVQADWISPNSQGYSNYYPFVHSTDGIHPEMYSFYQGREEAAAFIIKQMKAVRHDLELSGNPAKTVWPILQNFKGGDWHRFPNADELRVMSYEAIIHGANGITWFCYTGKSFEGSTLHAKEWENHCRVTKELSALTDVFLEEESLPVEATVTEGPEKDAYGYPSISVLAKKHNGRLFLICANSARADVAMKISCPGMARARVWFEDNREITIKDGVLADRFATYGVHVYELEP